MPLPCVYLRPSNGGFLQEDPLGLVDDLNPVAYVGGNPLSSTDPFGTSAVGDVVADVIDFLSENAGWIAPVLAKLPFVEVTAMGRLTAKVRLMPGATSHQVAKEGGTVPSKKPATLEIAEQDGAYFLFRMDTDGHCLADTWHLTLEEAFEQAEFEYGVCQDAWMPVESLTPTGILVVIVDVLGAESATLPWGRSNRGPTSVGVKIVPV